MPYIRLRLLLVTLLAVPFAASKAWFTWNSESYAYCARVNYHFSLKYILDVDPARISSLEECIELCKQTEECGYIGVNASIPIAVTCILYSSQNVLSEEFKNTKVENVYLYEISCIEQENVCISQGWSLTTDAEFFDTADSELVSYDTCQQTCRKKRRCVGITLKAQRCVQFMEIDDMANPSWCATCISWKKSCSSDAQKARSCYGRRTKAWYSGGGIEAEPSKSIDYCEIRCSDNADCIGFAVKSSATHYQGCYLYYSKDDMSQNNKVKTNSALSWKKTGTCAVATKLQLNKVDLLPPSKWAADSNPEKLIDDNPWTEQGTSSDGPVYIILHLATPSVITQVSLFQGDESVIVGAKVYIISETNEKVLCGEADEENSGEYSGHSSAVGDAVSWGQKYSIKCSQRVSGKAVRVESTTENFILKEVEVLGYASSSGMITNVPFEPTEGPLATEEPYNRDVIEEAPIFVENDDGIEEWDFTVEEPIPYKVLTDIADSPKAVETPLGYLAFAGYLDYSLDTTKASESRQPAGSGGNKERTTLTQDELEAATQSFLRFNGFVEGESITNEMAKDYMNKSRCGNPDLEYSDDKENCVTLRKDDIRTAIRYTTQTFIDENSFILPDNEIMIPDNSAYFYEVDVKYAALVNKRSKAIFLGFNYDETVSNGQSTPLEVIAMRFLNGKLCAQFLILRGGKLETGLASRATVMSSCYTPTANEGKTHAFKIRLDVYNARPGFMGKVYVTVKGEDVAQNVYKTPIKSAVVTMSRDDHTLTLSRLCKRPQLSASSSRAKRSTRNKRYALSIYSWQVEEMKFNFQNYSSKLKQDGTRQAILKAVDLYSKETGLKFKEVAPTSLAQIVFMFIRGKHADGMSFSGADAEKAHAYSPVHSEIHFNDYEPFELRSDDYTGDISPTSLFYVATHEIGHALGLFHSEKRSAVMAAGYPTETAFQFKGLHEDDKNAVNFLYPVEGDGFTEPLTDGIARHVGTTYTPKSPLPKECHSKIDAALNIGGKYFLISGPFAWRLSETVVEKDVDGVMQTVVDRVVEDGFPKRIADVFPQATGTIDAMFTIEYKAQSQVRYKVYVIHDESKITYYNFNAKSGYFNIDKGGNELSDVLVVGGTKVDKPIKAAFSITSEKKTILVTKDLMYYEIIWNKKGVFTSITLKRNTAALLGREISSGDFNAAMTYTRIFPKRNEEQEEVYNFGYRVVYSELVFSPSPRDTAPYQEVSILFQIAGWCPPDKTSSTKQF